MQKGEKVFIRRAGLVSTPIHSFNNTGRRNNLLSFRRKPESSHFNSFWTPAFAGVTTFYEFIKSRSKIKVPPMLLYKFLDIFFLLFHTLIIFFNLSGWVWKKTRIANLAMLSITAFSWFILGIWYGFGYCFCVDWHWTVKMKLGQYDLPNSYIKYLLDLMTGLDWNATLVDLLTFVFFFSALFASIFVNARDWRRKKRSGQTPVE